MAGFRNYRVEFPHWKPDDAVCFATLEEATHSAKEWAIEDGQLILVWDFGASMYVGRYDGRDPSAGDCDICGLWSDHLTTRDADNPDRVRDICLICKINGH